MVELFARSPAAGQLPMATSGAKLEELAPLAITSVALLKGGRAKTEKALGLAFPEPGRTTGTDDRRMVWTGRDKAWLIGQAPKKVPGAVWTDQSDAWTVVRLSGDDATDVLARLVPVDMRLAAFPEGATCRTLVFHMNAQITRSGAQDFDIMVFRSMAATLVHDLGTAMKAVAARRQNAGRGASH